MGFVRMRFCPNGVMPGGCFIRRGFVRMGLCPGFINTISCLNLMVATFHDSNNITIINIWGDESGGCRGQSKGSRGIVYVTVMNFVLGPHTRLYERQPASLPARQPVGTSLPLSARQCTSRCLTDVTAKFISGPSLARGRAVTGCDILRFALDLRARILAGV